MTDVRPPVEDAVTHIARTPVSHAAQQRLDQLSREPLVTVGVRGGLFRGTLASVRDVWAYRELLALLVRRELKVRYKDSALGFLWTLLRPLALLVVYYVAVGKFLGAQRAIPDFAVFVFAGLTAWQLFSEIVSTSTSSILSNAGLVRKVYLPREIFPLSTVGSSIVNFLVQVVVLAAAVLLLSSFPTGSDLLYAPIATLMILLLATAVGLALAAVNVYLRDVQYLVEIVLLVGFWTTPVVYSYAQVSSVLADAPALETLYLSNPMAIAVMAFQRTFWAAGGTSAYPDDLMTRLLIMTAISLLLLWLAQRLFARLSGNFAQEL